MSAVKRDETHDVNDSDSDLDLFDQDYGDITTQYVCLVGQDVSMLMFVDRVKSIVLE